MTIIQIWYSTNINIIQEPTLTEISNTPLTCTMCYGGPPAPEGRFAKVDWLSVNMHMWHFGQWYHRFSNHLLQDSALWLDCLDGPMVKASASRVDNPGFESRLQLDFSGSSRTSDFKISAPVATLPGVGCYRVSTGTGWLCVSILWLDEEETLICNLHLSVAALKLFWADPSLRSTNMLLGREADNQQQQQTTTTNNNLGRSIRQNKSSPGLSFFWEPADFIAGLALSIFTLFFPHCFFQFLSSLLLSSEASLISISLVVHVSVQCLGA